MPPGPFPFYGTVVAQFVFLFLLREIFRETSTEMDVNTVKVIVKSNNFTWSILLSTIEMTSKYSQACDFIAKFSAF